MSLSEHEQPGIGGNQTCDRDEDQAFDEWYAAAVEALERGAVNPFGLDPQDLEPIVVLSEELFGNADASGADGASEVDGAHDNEDDEDDEDQAFDDESDALETTPDSGRICYLCGGSGFESGGDGAQCQSCAGSG